MLVLGILSCAQPQHPTNLTPGEQRNHVTLWTMFASPLLIGCALLRIGKTQPAGTPLPKNGFTPVITE